jgi:hypothetical protein
MIACIRWFPGAQISAESEMEWRDNRVYLLEPDGSAVEGILQSYNAEQSFHSPPSGITGKYAGQLAKTDTRSLLTR